VRRSRKQVAGGQSAVAREITDIEVAVFVVRLDWNHTQLASARGTGWRKRRGALR